MTSIRILIAAALIAALSAPAIALAQTGDSTTSTPSPTTISVEGGAAEPAVPAPPPAASDDEAPWTVRYLIPIVVLVSVLLLVGLAWYYVFRIENRYVVERS